MGYLTPNYIRTLEKEQRWCQEWWRHAEAVARLYALWRSFEAHRVSDNASSMAMWWRDFADPTMASLTQQKGVFEMCNGRTGEHVAREESEKDGIFITKAPPWGMFTDERRIVPAEYAEFDEED